MGQRHQLFVIASILGKYRNLAAIHHQWLYGATALKRCHRLVQIFQAIENRIPLEQELISARNHDEQFWKSDLRSSGRKAVIPFPMITTCLTLGASFDVMDGYFHGVHIEPFGMNFDEGDNNNGITVIDISELHRVRYCFVDMYGMESETRVPLMTPLLGSTYLWAYYDKNNKEHQEMHGHTIDKLEKWDLVDVAALRDTWPDGAWRDPGDDQDLEEEEYTEEEEGSEEEESLEEEEGSGEEAGPGEEGIAKEEDFMEPTKTEGSNRPSVAHQSSAAAQSNLQPDESPVSPRIEEKPPIAELASLSTNDPVKPANTQVANQSAASSTTLRDSAMNTVIETALRRTETELELWMPEAELLTDFLHVLKRKIYEDPCILKASPAGLYLLCKALEDDQIVDLSPFGTLSSNDIGNVVSKFKKQGCGKYMVLSNLPDLCEKDLEVAFAGKIHLKGLCLIGTPSISINYLVSFIESHMPVLQDLYHSQLMRRPFMLGLKQWRCEDKIKFPANLVNQMIWIRDDVVRLSKDEVRLENGHVDWKKIMHEEESVKSLNSTLTYGTFPIDDILLPPVKFVTGLLNFLSWAVKQSSFVASTHDHGIGLANSLAMAKSSINGSDCQVGPLPTALYAARSNICGTGWPFAMSSLTPGKWTIVVVHEALGWQARQQQSNTSAKLRYAMVTTRDSSTQDLVVADMSVFLDQVTKAESLAGPDRWELQSYWTEHCKSILPDGGEIDFCDELEVRDLVRAVFAPYKYAPGRFDPYG